MEIMKYKGYEGTAEVDMERFVCRGKILFIDDLVTYEADNPKELQVEFEAAVDDYLETCELLGRDPKKPLKGQFNVRIPPALHKKAVLRSLRDNVSLNEIVVRAIDAYLNSNKDISHNITIEVTNRDKAVETVVATTSSVPNWVGMENTYVQ